MTETGQSPASSRPPLLSRYTYRYHLRAEALQNLFWGVFMMADVVARKALDASDAAITLLTMASSAFMLFSAYWAFRMEGRPKGGFILWAGILGRGALLFVAIATNSIAFILLCSAVFLSNAVFIPAQNSIFQSNYSPEWRGRMLGRAMLWTRWLVPVGAWVCGRLLDGDPTLYRWVFPVAAVIGIAAYVQYAVIRLRRRPKPPLTEGEDTAHKFLKILLDNPRFFRFEIYFFIYGSAFMMLLPVNVFLFVDYLHMTYEHIAIAKLVIAQMLVGLLAPLAGLLFDRLKAIRAAGLAFAMLTLYPLSLFLAWRFHSETLVFVAFAFYGVAMAGVWEAWTLGAMHFSGDKDAAPFQGVHLTAVGMRGLIAPWIGLAIYLSLGFGTLYITTAALFLLSALLMFSLDRRKPEEPSSQS